MTNRGRRIGNDRRTKIAHKETNVVGNGRIRELVLIESRVGFLVESIRQESYSFYTLSVVDRHSCRVCMEKERCNTSSTDISHKHRQHKESKFEFQFQSYFQCDIHQVHSTNR